VNCGYITGKLKGSTLKASIPNKEIRYVFEKIFKEWLKSKQVYLDFSYIDMQNASNFK
jgi:hypothetical protein